MPIGVNLSLGELNDASGTPRALSEAMPLAKPLVRVSVSEREEKALRGYTNRTYAKVHAVGAIHELHLREKKGFVCVDAVSNRPFNIKLTPMHHVPYILRYNVVPQSG